jgi:thioredoxin 1
MVSKGVVLLEFYADWCAPCKRVSPALHDLAREFAGKIRLVTLNVDADSHLVYKHGVYSIPTVLFLRNGHEVNRLIGAKSKGEYRAAITHSLKKE